jgi:hypothetical protein
MSASVRGLLYEFQSNSFRFVMEVITIEKQAFLWLLKKFNAMHVELQHMKNPEDQFAHE